MVYGSGLENRQAERPRGFESHPLRHDIFDFRFQIFDWSEPSEALNTTRVAARRVDCIAAREAGERSGDREINNPTPLRQARAGLAVSLGAKRKAKAATPE